MTYGNARVGSVQRFADDLRGAAAEPTSSGQRGLWLSFLDAYGLEVSVLTSADWVGVDLQHGVLDPADVPALLRVAEKVGLPLLTRVSSHAADTIGRVLDAGVQGVIVPAVESAAEARELASACLLPPRGKRTAGVARSTLGVVSGGADPLLLPMVETREGLAHAEEILAVDEIDGLFVGPYDLSLSMGFPAPDSAQTVSAVRSVIALARKARKIVGFHAANPTLVALAPEADLVTIDSDVTALRLGLAQLFD
ncbi:MAG: HpcH/HpaI aldolase family protein [Nostocoides sp.]